MRQWFFEDPAAIARLYLAVEELRGTPFRRFSCAPGPGGGIDCLGAVEFLFTRSRLVQAGDFHFARQDADYQSHRLELRVLRMLRGEVAHDPQSLRLANMFSEIYLPENRLNIDPQLFLPGDLLILRHGGEFHMPVMLRDRRFIHCADPLGVQTGNIHDTTYSAKLDAVFRAVANPV